MSRWSRGIRQTHRGLSILFTVLVLANVALNFVAQDQETLALWVGAATLIPLFLLLATGLYLFVLPYAAKRRRGAGDERPLDGRR